MRTGAVIRERPSHKEDERVGHDMVGLPRRPPRHRPTTSVTVASMMSTVFPAIDVKHAVGAGANTAGASSAVRRAGPGRVVEGYAATT
jgi:hypothetical protein